MFCPNCGTRNSTEQKFCRACGLNLEKSIESLAEQLPTAESADLLGQAKMLEKYGNFAFGGLASIFLIAVLILIYTVFNKWILSGANVFFGLLFIAFIIFAVLALVYVFLNEIHKEKKSKVESGFGNQLKQGEAAKLLEEKTFETVPASVVERTTDLLYAEKRRITDELG